MAFKKFQIDTTGLEKLEKQLDDALKYVLSIREIFGIVAKKLTPVVQPMLSLSLKNSDIVRRSGELERMVAGSTVTFTKKGKFYIAMPAGYSKQSYAKAGAIQYGALHRSGVNEGKGRKKLKKIISREGVGKTGTVYFEPHDYYKLTQSNIDTIQAKLIEFMNEELAKRIKK